ncbi:MAG: hypothetical protein QME51_00530 [Planctomycetota bacterium]|nr:hypothetical protein [Planctomycetota bacterium]MDI6786845.1 hypothetical protein [Planctomycetota bacterium]
MKNRLIVLMGLMIIGIYLIGCAGWRDVSDPQKEGYFCAQRIECSKDLNIAFDKATTEARTAIAEKIAVAVTTDVEKLKREVGAPIEAEIMLKYIKGIAEQTKIVLTDIEITKRLYKKADKEGLYYAEVTAEYPKTEVYKSIIDYIKKNPQLFQLSRETPIYKEWEIKMTNKPQK